MTTISCVTVASCSFHQELAVVTGGMDETPRDGLTVQERKKGACSYADHSGEAINKGIILQGGLSGLPAGRQSITADSRIFGACKVLERGSWGKADQIDRRLARVRTGKLGYYEVHVYMHLQYS